MTEPIANPTTPRGERSREGCKPNLLGRLSIDIGLRPQVVQIGDRGDMRPATNGHVRTKLPPMRLGPLPQGKIPRPCQLTVQGTWPPSVRIKYGIQDEIAAVDVDPGRQSQLAQLPWNLDFDVVAFAVEQERLLAWPAPSYPAGALDPAVQTGPAERLVLEHSRVGGLRDEWGSNTIKRGLYQAGRASRAISPAQWRSPWETAQAAAIPFVRPSRRSRERTRRPPPRRAACPGAF